MLALGATPATALATDATEPLSGLQVPASGPSRWDLLAEGVTRVPGDFGRILSYPFDRPEDFGKYALGVGLLIAFDKPITRGYQDHIETPLSGFKIKDPPGNLSRIGTGGTDGWLVLGIAGTYAAGFVTGDTLAQKTGIGAGKSLVYSMVISQFVLKSLAGRKRPVESISNDAPDGTYTNNPYDFGNRRKPTFKSDQLNSSVPSFHLTAWFAAAKVCADAYDNNVIPYSLVALGLVSNIRGHRHWVSDMTAGALIGTLIGSSVSDGYLKDEGKVRMQAAIVNRGPYLPRQRRNARRSRVRRCDNGLAQWLR